ncbi:OLC1v1017806C1 [Oldenlandia corymbosa var. corymbosa]|uniref:mRNA guanylyltransferase n=1 Tax=Oldenlandia corymbosa var. corymbosa TaxID=529605 RepID=A0AAV1EA94_OLDCO|nr:OLC1v1017806C1 [Oldenlandia corymbosa var. corymbosa]
MNQQRTLSRRIGWVIDLTNSDPYYSSQELMKEFGVRHTKIACQGNDSDSVPDNESVNRFVYEVSRFLDLQKRHENDRDYAPKYILVHCRHGHNRTGYMIVHYLMRTSPELSVTQAIQMFADARPPGIYKPDYINALYAFYHEQKPETFVRPSTPEWERSNRLDQVSAAAATLTLVSNETNAVLTNDDVLGDSIPLEQRANFRKFCYQALNLAPVIHGRGGAGNGYTQFPGSHPVSLNSENLIFLRQRYYSTTWKADGTRYMMLITQDGCYLIDRHFDFRRVQMRFPCRTNEVVVGESMHHFTLLDGEMVIDTLPDSQKQVRSYLIYDMMTINSKSIVNYPFHERWEMLEKEVIEPRNFEWQHISQCRNPNYRYELEPFQVRRKDFWTLSTVNHILTEFIPSLSHPADGLIFQGWDDPYVPRTHEGLLKWKYAEMNSVDFLFEVDQYNGGYHLYLYDRGRMKLMGEDYVVFQEGTDPLSFIGKIIECGWNEEQQVWVFMRVRLDKATPNGYNTYLKVMRSIQDNITQEILLEKINETIQLPMYAQ